MVERSGQKSFIFTTLIYPTRKGGAAVTITTDEGRPIRLDNQQITVAPDGMMEISTRAGELLLKIRADQFVDPAAVAGLHDHCNLR